MAKTALARFTASYLLDARPDQLDLRDREFQPGLQHLPANFPALADWQSFLPRYLQQNMVLDQGQNGACTGFALAALIQYSRARLSGEFELVSPRMLYHLARFYDEFPGENYQGSSCRGVLKAWHRHGVCRREYWPYTVSSKGQVADYEAPQGDWANDALLRRPGVYYRINKLAIADIQAALCQAGVVLASASIHKGWNSALCKAKPTQEFHDWSQLPIIPASSKSLGGHAFAILGYTAQGFIVQNSWGSAWGWQGFALLPYEDWQKHALDAWVFTLAAAQTTTPLSLTEHAFLLPSFSGPGVKKSSQNIPATSGQISDDAALQFLLMNRRDGKLQQLLLQYRDSGAAAQQAICDLPEYWFKTWKPGKPDLKIALIFLDSQTDLQATLRLLKQIGPDFFEAGIYPLFICQETPLPGLLQQRLEQTYASLAATYHGPQGSNQQLRQLQQSHLPALWLELQHSAQLASQSRQACSLYELSTKLSQLRQGLATRRLQLHLIAQGTGVFLLQHGIHMLRSAELPVNSVQLVTPLCSFEFAATHWPDMFKTATTKSAHWHLYLCDSSSEKQQYYNQAYAGSLSQLYTRGLEYCDDQYYLAWYSEWQRLLQPVESAVNVAEKKLRHWAKKPWNYLHETQKGQNHQRDLQPGIHLLSIRQKHQFSDLICLPELRQSLLQKILKHSKS